MRTTLDIDGSVLRELKARGRREGKTAGRLASELLAVALRSGTPHERGPTLEWRTGGNVKVDLYDEDALEAALKDE